MVFSRSTLMVGTVVLFASGGCDILESDADYREFKITADSIQVPVFISASEPLPVRVFAQLGSDCRTFSHFQAEKSESQVALVAWGRQDIRKDINCPDMIVMMDETYMVPPPYQSPFQVEYDQPDGEPLGASVVIQ